MLTRNIYCTTEVSVLTEEDSIATDTALAALPLWLNNGELSRWNITTTPTNYGRGWACTTVVLFLQLMAVELSTDAHTEFTIFFIQSDRKWLDSHSIISLATHYIRGDGHGAGPAVRCGRAATHVLSLTPTGHAAGGGALGKSVLGRWRDGAEEAFQVV
jgi:hypothetical protein